MAIPDPSLYDHFPQFDPSDLDFLPDADFPFDGLTSDLDLVNIPIDFSIDDLLLPEDPDPDPDPNPPSPESANSTVINNHKGCALERSKIEGDDVIPSLPDSDPDPHPPSPESTNSTIINHHHQEHALERSKIENDDVIPILPDSDPDSHPLSPESANSAAVRYQGCTLKRKKFERNDDAIPTRHNPNPLNCAASSPSAGGNEKDEKRKVVRDDVIPASPNPNKLHRSDEANSAASTFSIGSGGDAVVDDKRKARLMRNRESAQLSRQRRKHYVEELEEKVRSMSSVIADLNGKISFYMAENARLHHQLTSGAGAAVPPPPPHPQMRFPWIPFPGYSILPNGSHHAPVVPIPRLKPQQPAPAPKAKAKKSRTKKVAGVSLFGLFLVYLMLGVVLNFGFGGSKDAFTSGKGRILSVSGWNKGLNHTEEIGHRPNSSVSMPALLYVPRNGKRVEINGNLIIHSVLASERAVAEAKSGGKGKRSSDKEDTSLAILGNVGSALAVPKSERRCGRHERTYRNVAEGIRALVSDSHGDVKSTPVDGPLQQWFSEGLAGPILSSGTCTEVFQFEVSPSSANPSAGIVPATTSTVNATDKLPTAKNRRILYAHPIPLAESAANDTHRFGQASENKTPSHANSTVQSMVVSVMADPREAGDGDCDGMVVPKSISRIFVVVLMDSVKYVTYSCMLPLKSYGSHLVN